MDISDATSVAGVATTALAGAGVALAGVESVDPVDVGGSQVYAEKYAVTFEQPLDHKDPSAGTFPQRVEVGIVKEAKSNVMETDGYLLVDSMSSQIAAFSSNE